MPDTELAENELTEAVAEQYQQNCHEVASACEDLHHRNLARLALLHNNHGVEVPVTELLNIKVEILFDLFAGQDELQRRLVSFTFQQKLADLLNHLEADHGHEHDHEEGEG